MINDRNGLEIITGCIVRVHWDDAPSEECLVTDIRRLYTLAPYPHVQLELLADDESIQGVAPGICEIITYPGDKSHHDN
jgi:hypothetical protein